MDHDPREENRFLRALLDGRLLPARQLAKMKQTVPVSVKVQELWPDGRYGLGLVERPLNCAGSCWSQRTKLLEPAEEATGATREGTAATSPLNGVTDDGRRSAVVSSHGSMALLS
ncbi:hypothetical protein GCM10010384_67970 [Streptomyces djakartensis]|uniref:Uncharacterized protein n=1 Tax=Streptomyces djakartensis TaxID=68193 RepID=A0ABQ3AJ34_9ACTN|nr:hypothetical protein GCM10010384_67970 [Streptomyces djakartensis]